MFWGTFTFPYFCSCVQNKAPGRTGEQVSRCADVNITYRYGQASNVSVTKDTGRIKEGLKEQTAHA
jgi:hypothetical protein